MSDPQPDKLKPRPPRAEPLQPDLPAQGNGQQQSETESAAKLDKKAAKRQMEQTDAALDNVSKGYD